MIIKEWKCAAHGHFEGSHAICPAMGCDSSDVTRAFLTAPGFKSDKTKFTDSSLRAIATDYGLADMNNRGGEAVAKAPGDAIWGGREALGESQFNSMMEQAKAPVVIEKNGQRFEADGSGMKAAAQAFGVDKKRLPPAEVMVAKNDESDRVRVKTA